MAEEKRPLFGFDGLNGYKKDERGTWYDNGEFSRRHSVDELPDGSLQEHTVTTNKATGEVVGKESANYRLSGCTGNPATCAACNYGRG